MSSLNLNLPFEVANTLLIKIHLFVSNRFEKPFIVVQRIDIFDMKVMYKFFYLYFGPLRKSDGPKNHIYPSFLPSDWRGRYVRSLFIM